MGEAVDKMDNMLFHSPGTGKTKTTKLVAAVATQQAAMRWKLKAGLSRFGKKDEDNKDEDGKSTSRPSSSKAKVGAFKPKPQANLMGAAVAAAAMAQAEQKKKEEAASGGAKSPDKPVPKLDVPRTPASRGSILSSRQATPSDRPATKASVLLSLQGSEGALTSPNSPHPPSTAASGSGAGPAAAQSGDDDLAQMMNPFSPQV